MGGRNQVCDEYSKVTDGNISLIISVSVPQT